MQNYEIVEELTIWEVIAIAIFYDKSNRLVTLVEIDQIK